MYKLPKDIQTIINKYLHRDFICTFDEYVISSGLHSVHQRFHITNNGDIIIIHNFWENVFETCIKKCEGCKVYKVVNCELSYDKWKCMTCRSVTLTAIKRKKRFDAFAFGSAFGSALGIITCVPISYFMGYEISITRGLLLAAGSVIGSAIGFGLLCAINDYIN
jgi:hypothetical protein